MDASVDTMGSNDPFPYVDNWFDGKTIRNARKILVRWTEKKEAVANDMKFCGNMYSHYFNYKLRRFLHKTRRGGELDASPITLYFSIDDQDLNLDIAPRRQKTGRPPHEFTHTLNSGDILLFDTCRLKHRSSKPTDSDTEPYRVNVATTGL